MLWMGGSSKETMPEGTAKPPLIQSRIAPRAELNVAMIHQGRVDVVESAQGVEVVFGVVVERRLFA